MLTSTREIRHQHFSTTNLQEFALQCTRNGFMCPICHVLEDPVREAKATHRVILSDSTLYGIWDQPELPNICSHFDMECIVGGHIKDLTKALRRILEVVKGRLEVVLVGGISNIESGDCQNYTGSNLRAERSCETAQFSPETQNPRLCFSCNAVSPS